MDDRTILLIGKDKLKRIQNLKIAVIGIGGVGSYTLESLIRLGIKNILIIDSEKIELSNLNRQLVTTRDNIGKSKVLEYQKRALKINPDINIKVEEVFLNKDNINLLDNYKIDYLIDTCDTISTKKALIKYASTNNIKIISALSCGKRLDASKFMIKDLKDTSYDKIARELRKYLRKENLNIKVPVLISTEEEVKTESKKIPSISYVPAVAGLLITNYLVNEELKKFDKGQ